MQVKEALVLLARENTRVLIGTAASLSSIRSKSARGWSQGTRSSPKENRGIWHWVDVPEESPSPLRPAYSPVRL